MTQHSTSPVPLYLFPQALSEEFKNYGDAIAEVRIRRTTSHNCVMKVKRKRPGVWVAAATRAALVTECISKRSSAASHRASVAYGTQ